MIAALCIITLLLVIDGLVEFPVWVWNKYLDWREGRWLSKHLRAEWRR